MCFSPGKSTASVNAPKGSAAEKEFKKLNPLDDTPMTELTDEALRKRRSAEMLRLISGQGRKSTFLTGPTGLSTLPTLGKSTLLGGG